MNIGNYNLEYFKNIAYNKLGSCLSIEYKNTSSILEFKCHKGHIWKTKAVNIIYSNSWCPYCNGNAKDNLETFKKIAIERGGECLSEKYVNSKTRLRFKCENNHEWETIPEAIKNSKTWCPTCIDKNIPLTINEMKKIAIERGGECLSDIYINNNTNLKWKCDKGHEWLATPNRIKSAKTWCLECSGSKKKTIEEVQEYARQKNGKCLSKIYITSQSKSLLFECEFGHQWVSSYHTVKNSNCWCPICVESSGENIIRNYLNNNCIDFIKQKKYNDCRNKYPLPFDFYLPKFNILIEYDGRQHFESIDYFGGEEGFKYTQLNDSIKNNYARINNINLIRIAYTEKDIITRLNVELKKLLHF